MDKRKKIIVFTTSYLPFIGGAEIAVREVSRRLSDAFDFYIITARQKRELPKREAVPEGIILRVGFGTAVDKWLLPMAGFAALIRLSIANEIPSLWKHKACTSILLWGMDVSAGSLCASFIRYLAPKIPFVLTVQYGYGDVRLAKGRMGAIGMAFRRMVKAADCVTAISSYLRATNRAFGYAGVERIIPNGVDTSVFSFDASRGQETSNKRQRVIMTTSRLVPKNGVDILIQAVYETRKKIHDLKCYIIGDGPERARLEKLVKELHLENNVIFLGSVSYEEIPFYLRKADVFVRLSRFEGMGNSFVEALSVGVPVIGTPVGGIPDIIEDRVTGLLCQPDDPRDAADNIVMALEDHELALQLRKNGRALVEEKFSWDAIVQSYGDLFQQLLNARTRVLVATPLYPPEIGGPATYSKALVDGILERGVLARVTRFSDVRRWPKIVRHIGYAWRVCFASRHADIIYAQDPVSVGFPAAIASIIMRKPFAIKIVGDYAWEQGVQRFHVADLLDDFLSRSYGLRIECLRKLERFSAKRARRIVVPSHYLKTVVSRWGIPETRINVIYNSFEMPALIAERDLKERQKREKPFHIISAGRLVPWKGFATLIDAVADLAHDIPLILTIIGSGPMEAQLRKQIDAQGCDGIVELAGNVEHEEMFARVSSADAFVLNTGYEGFSHAILEAMAMGTPVITTRVGGNPELVTDGENGFLVEYDNKNELMQAILSLAHMPADKQKEIIRRAKETSQQFSRERMLEETALFLESI